MSRLLILAALVLACDSKPEHVVCVEECARFPGTLAHFEDGFAGGECKCLITCGGCEGICAPFAVAECGVGVACKCDATRRAAK